jgi:hypothetical protein
MSSLEELRRLLAAADIEVETALAQLGAAKNSFSAAISAAASANPNHPELVIPPEFTQAEEETQRILDSVAGAADVLRNFVAGL